MQNVQGFFYHFVFIRSFALRKNLGQNLFAYFHVVQYVLGVSVGFYFMNAFGAYYEKVVRFGNDFFAVRTLEKTTSFNKREVEKGMAMLRFVVALVAVYE